jgi:6-phosphogluconolactonase (cycloisomerase 2 family)
MATLLLTTALALSSAAQAQSNYVYVNNQATSNTISAYSVSSSGALTAVPGSPFLTGGRGANVNCYGLDRIVISAPNNLLFVTNTLDLTISALQINPASGSLTAVAGSPFASGLTLDACQGISLAATPDGKFLMASSNGQIQTFSIAAGGALSLAATTPNCCTPMVSMKISPNGLFLATSNQTSASVFTVNTTTGALTPVLGSPFPKTGTGTLAGLDFNSCGNNLLFGGEATATSTIADAWTVAASGALTAVPGSPFHSVSGTNSNVVLLSPDNTRLFESNQLSNSVNSFTVNANGSLTNIGSFGGTGFFHNPAGMATDQSGSFLYVADDPFGIAVLRINGDGSLTNLSDTAINRPGSIQGLAAYPSRSCATADFSLTMTAAPNPVVVGTNLTYSIRITNNGPAAAIATIEDILPSGKLFVNSCSATGGGVCSGTANHRFISFPSLLSGQTATATIVAQVSTSLANNSALSNTVSLSNSSAIDPNPANNSATATVNVVTLVPTTLTAAPANGTFGGSALLSANLHRSVDSSPIAGKSVAFTLNGSAAGSAITDATGTASLTTSIAGIAVGTYPGAVVATFAGDTAFATSSGTASLVVAPAVLTVTAGNASRIYGDPNPVFAFTISGFVNGDTAAVVSGSPICTSAPATSNAGSYPIVCSPGTLAATNYTFAFVDGTLTVTPAALTVTAANASRLYGDPNPAFTGTVTGLKNGDNITATYASTATPASPVGNYPIVPTLVDPTAKLGNYTVTSNNGTLTVNRAPLSVTAANATRVYGDPNPVFTGTITGIKNGDNITATYASAATAASPTGTYPIVPSLVDPTAKLGNYTVVSNNGTLTVSPALLTVTAANASRLFGDPNPVFTGTITGLKNGDNITATYATSATASSPVGTYPIVPTLVDPTGKLGNYTVVSNNGILTVAGALLTVTADNATRLYGDANPAFTGIITGLKNGDVVTATYASAATPASSVGTYAIVPTLVDPAGVLSNYAVTSNNGTLTVTAVPLTVTANNVSRLYGDPNPAFTGAITGLKNGDNITATYASVATPASPVGTYPIAPTLVDPTGKLSNYTVTSNNGVLTVNVAALTVSAANASRAYGDPNPLFSGIISGLKNGDNITATYASAATAASPVGTYPIVPTLVDPTGKLSNYTVTSTNGTLTVNPALLTVTAANASRAFGAPNPAFTGTITGLKNGDSITATFASTATAASPVGTYPIVPTLVDPTGKLSNYTVVSNNGVLTVTGASLTVTVDNASRLYGDPNPVFTGTITGIQNGDNITATYASVADPTSPVGTYAIVATLVDPTGKLANYSVVVNNGILTVTPAPLSVTADNASRLYGDPNPAFTGTIIGLRNNDNITAAFASAGPASPVGTYPITATLVDPTGKAGNYVVTFVNGTLTVSPTPLSVTAANASRFYGDPNPAFTGTITGIKNGDNITASYSSTATPASAPGTYPIVPALVDPTGKLSNYTVTALNNGILTVTPAPLTVTAANAARLYGDANPVLTGTITGIRNGDAITASYSTVATPASSVGTYAIVPALSDPTGKLANYTVVSNNGILTVNPAPLTVTGTNATRLYGDPNPTFTGTVSGLKNGDSITATFASAADPSSPVGSYAIIATLVDPGARLGNYTVISNNGILTVAPAPLAATATSATRLYGDPNPAFSGTITGLKNGDNITATFSSAATAASPVGTYPIVPSFIDPAGKLGNYTVTSSGTLTVTPAPLTASAANASRVYGDPNPVFTGTITGLRNGDNITESFTSAGPASPVGTYAIVPALVDPTGKAGNYTVTFSNGTLTVTPAPLSVAAANASRLYGDPNPAFTGTITGIKNGDNITASFATAATPASAVGTFAIVPTLIDPTAKLSNYTVTSTNGTLTINRAPLTVTAANVARTFGAANPALTGTITGIKNADNITATYATTAVASSPVGTYPITPTLVDPTAKLGNYTVTSVNGVLTVNKAPLTITANNQTKVLHAANPALTATYSGFVLGQTPASLTGTLTCTTTSTTLTAVGNFPITCSGQTSTNYAITFVPGSLSVLYASGGLCNGAAGHAILAPILANGTSSFLQGTTVPARFRVCDAAGVSQGTAGVVSSFFLVKIITGTTTTTVHQVPLGAPGFVFNTAPGQRRWEFNSITTANLPKGSTYGYQIGLNDGTSITFQFAVR